MKPYFWILLRFAALTVTLKLGAFGSFPENAAPISVTDINDVPSSVFTGGDLEHDRLRYVQDIKMMKIAGKTVVAILAREKMFFILPEDFSPSSDKKISPTEVYTWNSDQKATSMCKWKGQNEENCDNYIRVLESMDENGNKLLVCATNSFDPRCRYITATSKHNEIVLTADDETFSGSEKCAFGPDQTGVSLYTGNSLYSATVSEFSGRSYAISRSLGASKQLRTPKFDSKFLNEPHFVKMVDDGPRVLIFMNEMVSTNNGDIRMVAYVAQVCKNDLGGQHVLVRQWTMFEKSRLNCSLNGFYFDQLRDVSEPVDVHVGAESKNNTIKMIYATFSTPDNSVPGSAVCAFSLDSIHGALLGQFREEEKSSGDTKSSAPTGARHPGNCPTQQYSESELLFLKSHPLLEDQARGSLLNTQIGERWTSLAVDTAAGPHRNWTVYFVGTEHGDLLRYLAPADGRKTATLLRRQPIYDVTRCLQNSSENVENDPAVSVSVNEATVTKIVIDKKRNQIMMMYKRCVITVSIMSCNVHKCKEACLASADPYCGWNGIKCVDYVTPSVNVEQYVTPNAIRSETNIEDLCPEINISTSDKVGIDSESGLKNEVTDAGNESGEVKKGGDDFEEASNSTNGTTIDTRDGDGEIHSEPQGTETASSGTAIPWLIVGIVAAVCGILFFVIGFCCSKWCNKSRSTFDKEKQQDTIDASRPSIAMTESICKKAQSFIASISPKRKRKQPSGQTPSRNVSQSTLTDQNEPFIGKDNNKYDECLKHPPSICNESQLSGKYIPNGHAGSRLQSTASASQVTMTESLASYGSKRRNSSQPASSVTSMNTRGRGHYATAPRPRHFSGNRSSDPSEYSNASTLRADKVTNGRMSSRHSTPVPQVATPTYKDGPQFKFEDLNWELENTTQVLQGVEQVILDQQRRSQEMEAVPEEFDERARHDSSDSGKGSSPRNSMQNDDERANKVPTLPRPENLQLGQRGRKRLNSEPTSPTLNHPPLPPPSNHKPVSRSTSVRSQHAVSVPNHHRKRSESFSFQSQPTTPVGNNSPPRMVQAVRPIQQQPGYQQKSTNMYATLPTKPATSNRHQQMEQFNRQQSYDTYSPHNRYPVYDQRDNSNHPAMQLPDKYSSLPLRSQAHRSNKKPYVNGYITQQSQPSRHSNGAPPQFHKQMSSPANFDQRLKYVPPPTAPMQKAYPAPLPEQNAV